MKIAEKRRRVVIKRRHEIKIELLKPLYQQIAEVIGVEATVKLFKEYKGLTVNFPTRLFSVDFIKQELSNYVKSNSKPKRKYIQQKSLQYDYSERQIRRFLEEVLHNEDQT